MGPAGLWFSFIAVEVFELDGTGASGSLVHPARTTVVTGADWAETVVDLVQKLQIGERASERALGPTRQEANRFR